MKIIITGSTGMVGFGALQMAIQSDFIDEILIINRKSLGLSNPKVKEVITNDFFNLSDVNINLKEYDACFFCLGVSSLGMSKEDYIRITYDLTINFAKTLCEMNKNMTFIYVSGLGTDSDEKGNGWAAVKGKTENDLIDLPFKKVYAWRPGFIKPLKNGSNAKSYYKFINWIYPIGRLFYPVGFNKLEEVGNSMINILKKEYSKKIINGNDIRKISNGNY